MNNEAIEDKLLQALAKTLDKLNDALAPQYSYNTDVIRELTRTAETLAHVAVELGYDVV